MTKFKYILLIMLMFGISGCAAEAVPQEIPTDIPVEEDLPVPTLEVVPEPEPEVEAIDYCVDCHTEKKQLVDTAKPIVEVVSENEGAG